MIKIPTFALIIILLAIFFMFDINKIDHDHLAMIDYVGPTLEEDPTEPGPFATAFLTYGSGQDKHRDEFGAKVDEVTESVDASHFITSWRKSRERFWGFNQKNLPINGRVWLPEGKGPFPLLLITHGNHTMEYFSTAGYDYIGELLASKGIIAISIDQDFINYSNTYGIPNDNYTLRAWMFLKHLTHLQEMNADADSFLHQKIDFSKVALSGHSRGGQAAMMAADYESFFSDEDFIQELDSVNIEGVIAISPTDNSVDNKKPRIHNISYLLLHGARDADVYDFRGDLQYERTTFDKDYDGFKSTLYIADANHTHFNSDWGSIDLSLPRGLFLNQQETMEPEKQQNLTKGFIAAFLERIFHKKYSYEKLFQDYRYGKDWLPPSIYVQKYEHPTYQPLIQFQQGDAVHGSDFKINEIIRPKNRRGNKRTKDALHLKWQKNANYSMDLSDKTLFEKDQLVFTIANINEDSPNELPTIEVELKAEDGNTSRLQLDHFMPLPPVIHTKYTHFGLFDKIFRDGRYEHSWEPIFQTVMIPLPAFLEMNPSLDLKNIRQMSMSFTAEKGEILIEEIGIYPAIK